MFAEPRYPDKKHCSPPAVSRLGNQFLRPPCRQSTKVPTVWQIDNGGRRSGIERRRFSYSVNIPERRSGKDRRCGIDRRDGIGFKLGEPKERREIYNT